MRLEPAPAGVHALRRLEVLDGDHPAAARAGLGGAPLRLRRAWPRGPDRLTLEYTAGARVVAGRWTDRGGLELHGPDGDRRLPGLARAAAAPGARVLSHRAGRRATVARRGAFVKALVPGRVAAVAAAHRRAAGRGVDVPAVLGADEDTGLLTLAPVRGRALHDLLGAPGAEARLAAVGAALRRFHHAPRPTSAAAAHDTSAEAHVVAGWLDRLAALDPALAALARTAAEPALRALAALDPAPPVTLHRDLHDKQVFLTEAGDVALIDLDTLQRGDAAVDLANLAVHLELRALQAGDDAGAAAPLRAALLDGYRAGPHLVRRIAAYEAAVRVRLACVYAFRPRWGGLPLELLALERQAAA